MLSLLNPLAYDVGNFTNIQSQTKPPSANHLHFFDDLSILNFILWGFGFFFEKPITEHLNPNVL
jgi:hypothetical protein